MNVPLSVWYLTFYCNQRVQVDYFDFIQGGNTVTRKSLKLFKISKPNREAIQKPNLHLHTIIKVVTIEIPTFALLLSRVYTKELNLKEN